MFSVFSLFGNNNEIHIITHNNMTNNTFFLYLIKYKSKYTNENNTMNGIAIVDFDINDIEIIAKRAISSKPILYLSKK